jgi:hypothetical protein
MRIVLYPKKNPVFFFSLLLSFSMSILGVIVATVIFICKKDRPIHL